MQNKDQKGVAQVERRRATFEQNMDNSSFKIKIAWQGYGQHCNVNIHALENIHRF